MTACAPMPSASAAPGRRLCSMISAWASRPSKASTPSGDFKSSVTDFLPRLNSWKFSASPWRKSGPIRRASSPPSGFSTLITSAPRSAKIAPAKGPASTWPSSTTRTPDNTPVIAIQSLIRAPGASISRSRLPGSAPDHRVSQGAAPCRLRSGDLAPRGAP